MISPLAYFTMLSGGDLSQNQFESFNDDWWWSSVIHINESVPTQIRKKWQYDVYIHIHSDFLYMRKIFQFGSFSKRNTGSLAPKIWHVFLEPPLICCQPEFDDSIFSPILSKPPAFFQPIFQKPGNQQVEDGGIWSCLPWKGTLKRLVNHTTLRYSRLNV